MRCHHTDIYRSCWTENDWQQNSHLISIISFIWSTIYHWENKYGYYPIQVFLSSLAFRLRSYVHKKFLTIIVTVWEKLIKLSFHENEEMTLRIGIVYCRYYLCLSSKKGGSLFSTHPHSSQLKKFSVNHAYVSSTFMISGTLSTSYWSRSVRKSRRQRIWNAVIRGTLTSGSILYLEFEETHKYVFVKPTRIIKWEKCFFFLFVIFVRQRLVSFVVNSIILCRTLLYTDQLWLRLGHSLSRCSSV